MKKMLEKIRKYVKTAPKSQWCGFITTHTQIGGKPRGLFAPVP